MSQHNVPGRDRMCKHTYIVLVAKFSSKFCTVTLCEAGGKAVTNTLHTNAHRSATNNNDVFRAFELFLPLCHERTDVGVGVGFRERERTGPLGSSCQHKVCGKSEERMTRRRGGRTSVG